MKTLILQDTRAWAEAIAELPGGTPLPCRTVVVPNTRVAHGLRRELCLMGKQDVLAGTLFVDARALAAEVLWTAGVQFHDGEENLRPLRLRQLFAGKLKLEYFQLELLRDTQGWDLAFADAITELEAAGLTAADVEKASDAQVRDLGRVWAAYGKASDLPWTSSQVLARATRELEAGCRWPVPGLVLAGVTGHESAVEAAFLRSIPEVTLGLRMARPLRSEHMLRVKDLFTVEKPAIGLPELRGRSERDVLATFLFESPEVLATPDRMRSEGPDRTVAIEEHAGVEAELEAAADWIAGQILAGTPLENIAVLTPAGDTLVELIADRLERLPWGSGGVPVFVSGGRPATSTAAGTRVLAVIRALRAWLDIDSLGKVVPSLRAEVDEQEGSLYRGDCLQVVYYELGTSGGSPAIPRGALEWAEHATVRLQSLAAELAATSEQPGVKDDHRRQHAENVHRTLLALPPSLTALCELAKMLIDDLPLATLWPALRQFLEERVKLPGEGAPLPALMGESLVNLLADEVSAHLRGQNALAVIEDMLLSLRVQARRFGIPAVYVGTVASASGLRFAATRVLGLCEGALPSVPHEDPVLPDQVLDRLANVAPAARLVRRSRQLPIAQLHALDRIVRDTTGSIVFSVPQLDVSRTQREPSSVLIEVGAALGRPNSASREHDRFVPDLNALERDYFEPARTSARAARNKTPITDAARLDAVATAASTGNVHLPASWAVATHLDLVRIRELEGATGGPQHGMLGRSAVLPDLPGLSPERPTSASTLEMLLKCPYRFLLEKVLGLGQPLGPPSRDQIDALSYGSLLHRLAETFFSQYGQGFFAGKSRPADWREKARAAANAAFDEFLLAYPLPEGGVCEQQRRRLLDDFGRLIDGELAQVGKREFLAAERAFGSPAPLPIETAAGKLYLHGSIDRLDREGRRTLVRDLKTGKSHPRDGEEAGPVPTRDLQIGLYGIVTRQMAKEWKLPASVAASYVYVSGRGASERSFHDDFADLEKATRNWLEICAGLLNAHSFPRTPDGDCDYCPFQVLCGDAGQRALGVLARAKGAVAEYRDLKVLPVKAKAGER